MLQQASSSTDKQKSRKNEKSPKKHKKKKHRKRSSSSSSNDAESKKRSEEKKRMKKLKKEMKKKLKEKERCTNVTKEETLDVPLDLMGKTNTMAPMTKEQWEKQQSVIRKVYDETSGRYRLIKGDGEVIEQAVSKDQHKEINRKATKGDGEYFQAKLSSKFGY